MIWLVVVGAIVAVAVLGYVAHKYPTWFGKAVDTGATVVNSVDDKIKDTLNQK